MRRAITLLCAGALLALGCGSDSTPPATTPPFTDATCVPASCSGVPSGTFRTCTPPGAPRFVDGGTVVAADPRGACVRPTHTASTSWNSQALGVHAVGTQLSFSVPACTGSISIVSQGGSSNRDTVSIGSSPVDNNVAPTALRNPSGVDLLDLPPNGVLYSGGDPVQAQIWNGGGAPGTSAITFPNTTALLSQVCANGTLPAGTWTLTVDDLANDCAHFSNCSGGTSSDTYDVTVITKPPSPATGTVDVAFYLVDDSGFTSATAVVNAQQPGTAMERMVTSLEGIYANAGLCLGTVTFYSVPAWAQNAYATTIDADQTGPCSTLNQMFANLAQPGNALNLFFVSNITSSANGGSIVVGIDGTIPGPSAVSGTIHSGAAVSIADLSLNGCNTGSVDYRDCGADEVAYIAAHEGGHWMGLFHTTESPGDTFDSLSDTGTCPCTSCKPASASAMACGSGAGDYVMSVPACTVSSTCAGGDDLMFWVVDSKSRGTLSAQQGLVMRANPLVQ